MPSPTRNQQPEQHFQHALRLYRQGKHQHAATLCEQLLRQHRHFSAPLQLAGVIHVNHGNRDTGIKYLQKFTKKNPKDANGWNTLGCAYRDTGKLADALQALLKSTQLEPTQATALENLGEVYVKLAQYEAAIGAYRQAMRVAPTPTCKAATYNRLGAVYATLKQYDAAIAQFEHAVRLQPQHSVSHYNLGNALHEKGQYAEAIAAYQQAIDLNPEHELAHINLSIAEMDQGNIQRAERLAKATTARFAQSARAQINLGNILYEQKKVAAALTPFRDALALDADMIEAHTNVATCLLSQGDYANGWQAHEWRKSKRRQPAGQPALADTRSAKPEWTGEDLRGKTLLIRREQGFGDVIQFSRFITLLSDTGGRLLLECRPPLVALFVESYGHLATIISTEQALPKHDYQVQVMSLPYRLGITLDNLPADTPYFKVPSTSSTTFKTAFATENPDSYKVGIVWAGNPNQASDKLRSCGVHAYEPILSVPGVAFYSLQKETDEASEANAAFCRQHNINTSMIARAENYADTAALIQQLDLVISVCTSVAHLAGMLNHPTWVALSYQANWRWLMNRTDCPWYPNSILFRQSAPNHWPSVFKLMREHLLALA